LLHWPRTAIGGAVTVTGLNGRTAPAGGTGPPLTRIADAVTVTGRNGAGADAPPEPAAGTGPPAMRIPGAVPTNGEKVAAAVDRGGTASVGAGGDDAAGFPSDAAGLPSDATALESDGDVLEIPVGVPPDDDPCCDEDAG
jgi:hypothetical protein